MRKMFLFLGICLLVGVGKGICAEGPIEEVTSRRTNCILDMAVDNNGNLYISATPPDGPSYSGITKFNDKFKLCKDFGEDGFIRNKKGEKKILLFEKTSTGRLAIDKDYIYAADLNNGLLRFDLSGKKVSLPKGSDITGEIPRTVAVANKYIYTAGGRGYVKRFFKDGSLDKDWGVKGRIINKGRDNIAVDKNNNLYLGNNDKVIKYTPTGKIDISFGNDGIIEGFKKIFNIDVDEDGNLYVADYAKEKGFETVKSFNSNGEFITSYGEAELYGKRQPSSVAAYKDKVYTSTWGNQVFVFNRVTKVSR